MTARAHACRTSAFPSVRRVRLMVLSVLLFPAVLWVATRPTNAAGTVSLSAFGSPYAQDFNTLASSGTANTVVPTGWDFSESGTNANTTYRAGTGSDNAGDTYSFGSFGSMERAFGGLRSGSLVPLVGAQFTNNTGGKITSLAISYTGEQWRLGQNTTGRAADRLDFQLSTNATSLTSGTWTDYDSLDFGSPVVAGTVGALNGNVAPNRTALSFTIEGLDIANGASFWLRWADTDLIPGSDDGLAVDDFALTAVGVMPPLPTLGVNDVSAIEGNSGTTTLEFTVSLSAPAGPGGVTFDIATADGTAIAPGDYVARTLTAQSIPEGGSTYAFAVQVNGDTVIEDSESFVSSVTNATGATIADGQGIGTITNDDVERCGDPATFIHDVQGSGASSPLLGSIVSIEGIVTADYQGSGQFSGYFVQEEDGETDASPETSEGIFVFDTSFPVSVGDKVRVSGTVLEFLSSGQALTELTGVKIAQVCSQGNTVTPAIVSLPVADLADWERYEGMFVQIPQHLTVTDTFTLARYGEVDLSVGRLFAPTQVASPGPPALDAARWNDRHRILLDDGNNQQNIDPTLYPLGGLSAASTLRAGDILPGLTGILEQRFGAYRVQPVGPLGFTPANPRTATPQAVGGSLKVASFNVLNYFNGDGLGGGFPTSRGAYTLAEFTRQRTKIISAIAAVDADIVGLIEVENDALGNSAIEDLVGGLNAATALGTYAFIDTGVVGTDAIRNALIYKPAALSALGAHAILDSTVDPEFVDVGNRPTLAQTFSLNANGARLTVAVNHLRSKGSPCDAAGDPDTGDGQGNCNGTRTKAAAAIVRWLATDPTNADDADFLLMGDMNAYALEDPITAFKTGGFVDLMLLSATTAPYSYVFAGEAGYLDHALASAALAAQVTGVTHWHINADEPIALDYNVEFKSVNHVNTLYSPDPFRSSDHDPVVVGIDLGNAVPLADAGGPYSVYEGGTVQLTASGSDPDGTAVTFAWDLDSDGTFETPGQSASFTPPAGALTYTVSVQVTDATGQTAVDSATVHVQFNWTGFFRPVDNQPAVNQVNAGSAVPLKFSLRGDKGLNILAAGSPASMQTECRTGAPLAPPTPAASAGGSGLSYDPLNDQYTFVWKTDKAWAATCRRLILRLNDGTWHTADFNFRR